MMRESKALQGYSTIIHVIVNRIKRALGIKP